MTKGVLLSLQKSVLLQCLVMLPERAPLVTYIKDVMDGKARSTNPNSTEVLIGMKGRNSECATVQTWTGCAKIWQVLTRQTFEAAVRPAAAGV